VKVHLLLADAAQTDGLGKLGTLGLGWSITGTPAPPHAVVLLLRLGWAETQKPHRLELALVRADGEPVRVPETAEPGSASAAVRIAFELEVSRPVGLPEGAEVDHNTAFTIGPGLPFEAGTRYEWRLTVNGERDDEWVVPFYVRTPKP
jgi:hypothetical protein